MKVTGRTRAELFALVLKAAAVPHGATKTTLMYKSYLTFSEVQELLFSMQTEGLIQHLEGEMKFKATTKGLQFLAECPSEVQSLRKACEHQCARCGVLYACASQHCQKPFHYNKCSSCLNVLLQSSFGKY